MCLSESLDSFVGRRGWDICVFFFVLLILFFTTIIIHSRLMDLFIRVRHSFCSSSTTWYCVMCIADHDVHWNMDFISHKCTTWWNGIIIPEYVCLFLYKCMRVVVVCVCVGVFAGECLNWIHSHKNQYIYNRMALWRLELIVQQLRSSFFLFWETKYDMWNRE